MINLFGEGSWGIRDPDRSGVGFHLNHSSQLSSEGEQLILISEMRVVALGFQSGGSNHTS